ncbi:hypothetical protein D9619_004600 [Psilocybe cf. subviscida]|uniref:Uncharacterized protein n=1 Tax=Psilocybe cf. subviscida TaxID=2480587 RepID=A0A8H5BPD3_9AGAR|nr:hypothetical protein D9619_004600 [Psilocybe cf. subviscida]
MSRRRTRPSEMVAEKVASGGVSNMYINEPFYGAAHSHALATHMAGPSKPRLHNHYPPATATYLPPISRPLEVLAEEVAFGGAYINEPFYGAPHPHASVNHMIAPSEPRLHNPYPPATPTNVPPAMSMAMAREVAFSGAPKMYINEPFYGAAHPHAFINHVYEPSKPRVYNPYPPATATYLPPINMPSKAIAKKVAFGGAYINEPFYGAAHPHAPVDDMVKPSELRLHSPYPPATSTNLPPAMSMAMAREVAFSGAPTMYINEPFYGAVHPHTSANHMAGRSKPRLHNHYPPATVTYLPPISRPSKVLVEEVASSGGAKRKINGYYNTTGSQVVVNQIVPNHPQREVTQDGIKVIQGMEREAVLRRQQELDKERLRLAWEKQLLKKRNEGKALGPLR